MKEKYLTIGILIILFCMSVSGTVLRDNDVINKSNNDWIEIDKILASDGGYDNAFGYSISIDGDYAIISAAGDDDNGQWSGSAYIFKREGSSWVEEDKIIASDGYKWDNFGYSASISGDYAILGAPADDDNGYESGSAYIFKRDGTTWSEQTKLIASDGVEDDYFGWSVSISGDYAIIGARRDDDNGEDSGSAYIFKRDGATWSEQAKIIASDGEEGDKLGRSISIDGYYVIIGVSGDDDNGDASGSAYIFKREGESWIEEAKLLASDGERNDLFGWSVSIDGDLAIIGANSDTNENGVGSGSAYIFKRDGSSWIEEAKIIASDGAAYDYFGESVSISEDYAIIGAIRDKDHGDFTGSAYIFKREGENWTEESKLIASDGAEMDRFGCSVSISDGDAMVGARGNDDMGDGTGSAYLFRRSSDFSCEITGGLGADIMITNNGDEDVIGQEVEINIEVGHFGLFNKNITRTVDIFAGESVTIETGIIFGLGALDIFITIDDFNEKVTGFQLFILTIIN